MSCTQESGTCDVCRSGCTGKPGWFLPGEAERAAEFMGMTLPDFFARYLAVDWWNADSRIDEDVFVLSPAITDAEPGTEFPGDPHGTCVFYQDERCQIHPAKPHECRQRWCGDDGPGTMHQDVAEAWQGSQAQIRELLGRQPETEDYDPFGLGGLLSSLFGE